MSSFKGDLYREDDLYGSYVSCLQCEHNLSEAEEESICYLPLGAGNVDWRITVELETAVDDVIAADTEVFTIGRLTMQFWVSGEVSGLQGRG